MKVNHHAHVVVRGPSHACVRCADMVKYMKRIVQLCESGDEMANSQTGVLERNLISVHP